MPSSSPPPPPSTSPPPASQHTITTTTQSSPSPLLTLNPSTPNPYLTNATSRLRSALSRTLTSPYDTEAWQALITESQILYRQTSSNDPDRSSKLDWIESVYGSLLAIFPYGSAYMVGLVDILFERSLHRGEREGELVILTDNGQQQPSNDDDDNVDDSIKKAEERMEWIFSTALGTPSNEWNGMCTSSVSLWTLWIRKRERDSRRKNRQTSPDDKAKIRTDTTAAYETALSICGFVVGAHVLWRKYITFVREWLPANGDPHNNDATPEDHVLRQEQMQKLRSIYQRVIATPLPHLDDLWKEYSDFERTVSETLAGVLLAEHMPRYQHAKTVYLEKSHRGYVADYLKTGNRLPVPPVGHDDWKKKFQKRDDDDDDNDDGRNDPTADNDATATDDELIVTWEQWAEERELLSKWRRRCAYERTNPERLNASQSAQRVRQCYKEMAGAFMRHPETWHEWSAWEGTTSWERADGVLERALSGSKGVEDCVMLVAARVELLEGRSCGGGREMVSWKGVEMKGSEAALKCLEEFVDRWPCSLGFVLLQKMVRKYRGIKAARMVFARARRTLRGEKEVKKEEDAMKVTSGAGVTTVTSAGHSSKADDGTTTVTIQTALSPTTPTTTTPPIPPCSSPLTHHVYSTHASIEYHLNNAPQIAARTYELGLRKHPSFLSLSSYVLPYAHLLLHLHSHSNLRALLLRSIAACDERKTDARPLWDFYLRYADVLGDDDVEERQKLEMRRLKCIYDGALGGVGAGDGEDDGGAAGMGGGGVDGLPKNLRDLLLRSEGEGTYLISANLYRLAERFEATSVAGDDDVSSSALSSHRYFRDDCSLSSPPIGTGGNPSDTCLARRYRYHKRVRLGGSLHGGSSHTTGHDRGHAARERMKQQQQQQQAQQQAGQGNQRGWDPSKTPEWLRGLISLLPPVNNNHHNARNNRGQNNQNNNKPPPHMIEMALAFLKSSELPDKPTTNDTLSSDSSSKRRPTANDSTLTTTTDNGESRTTKRKSMNGNDSSDDETNNGDGGITGAAAGGYGDHFRKRQRLRQLRALDGDGKDGEGGGGDKDGSSGAMGGDGTAVLMATT